MRDSAANGQLACPLALLPPAKKNKENKQNETCKS